jgi:hypothetical protein
LRSLVHLVDGRPNAPELTPFHDMLCKTLIAATTGTLLLCLGLAWPSFADDTGPPAARHVTFAKDAATPTEHAKALKMQTGTEVDVSGLEAKPVLLPTGKLEFWPAVEKLAAETGSRVIMTGGRVSLKPGKSQAASSVSGPFRFVEREVLAKIDAETGRPSYEVIVDVCWEPWLMAFRMDSTPSDVQGKNDRGHALRVAKGGTRSLTTGNAASLYIRPAGIVRADQSINLKGAVRVTIAEEYLTFAFDGAKPQLAPEQKGVSANLKKTGRDGANLFAEIELRHGKGTVSVESYEYELFRNNTLELVSPKGERFKPEGTEFEDASTRYIFKNRAKQVAAGWKLEYRTPGPMREIAVPFDLKEIKLP